MRRIYKRICFSIIVVSQEIHALLNFALTSHICEAFKINAHRPKSVSLFYLFFCCIVHIHKCSLLACEISRMGHAHAFRITLGIQRRRRAWHRSVVRGKSDLCQKYKMHLTYMYRKVAISPIR